jgi:Glycosyl hydrolase family 99
MRTHQAIAVIVLFAALRPPATIAQPVAVAKTNPLKVYMHYMPWFETPDTLGPNQWGYHWKFNNRNPNIVDETGKRQIASHYYPKIGPYASSDPDVLEYHLLLMKLSGVDGVMIDWYGVQGVNGDINQLLANSNALVDRVDDVGLQFGVVLEDRFSRSGGFDGPPDISKGMANVSYLRDHYFNQSNYIRLGAGNEPLLAVFGPITFQQESDWTQILGEAGEDVNFLTLWYESAEAGANADGEYSWIYEDANQDNHLTHLSNFYRFRTPNIGTAAGSAYPGFNDFYEEGGVGNVVPFEIPHNDGATLDAVLELAGQYASRMDFLQLATFNDFGEGTMFEPTVETGFEYLKKIQQFTGTPYGEDELQLVYRLYLARKLYSGNAQIQGALDEVSDRFTKLDIDGGRNLLNSVAPQGDYDGDGDVDVDDYSRWRESFGTQTILYGSGADGNYDGVVNAADYIVWRQNMGVGSAGGGAATASVPEPSPNSLFGLAALTIYLQQCMRRAPSDE